MHKYLKLLLFILGLEILGGLSGFATKGSIESWYISLNRSPFTPPNYVFGIVWTILYAMIATSGWLLWESKSKELLRVKLLFATQVALNLLWTPLFFYFHYTGLALIWVFAIIVIVAVLINKLIAVKKPAALLLVPYLLWLLLAFQLNYYIWMYN